MNKRNVVFFVIAFLLVIVLTVFAHIWVYPIFLFVVFLISLLYTFRSRYWQGHQWKDFDKLFHCSYWPTAEDKKLHRSLVLLIMHCLSILIRCTSTLQYVKAFFKDKEDKGEDDVPAWVSEFYMLFWIAYIASLAYWISKNPGHFSYPLVGFLIYRAIHIVHGNLYYGLLRAMYIGRHRVYNFSRNLALFVVSYIELCLLFAVVYLLLGRQFCPPLTRFGDALYLSTTTITTLGHGDIRPAHSFARVLVASESLSGLALLGLAITRCLGLIPHLEEPE